MSDSPTKNEREGEPAPVEIIEPGHERRDAKWFERAARERWQMRPEYLENAPAEMNAIVVDPKAPRSRKTAAARTLAVFQSENLRDRHHVERMQHEQGILDLRRRWAEQTPEQAAQDGTGGNAIIPASRSMPLPSSFEAMTSRLLPPPATANNAPTPESLNPNAGDGEAAEPS